MSAFDVNNIRKIEAAFFSPTGNVKKIVWNVAETMGKTLGVPVDYFDFTAKTIREKKKVCGCDTLLIIGLPVYAGRVPNKILPFIQENLKGEDALAFPIVSFGNRSFDDALMELSLELENNGFRNIATMAIVSEHAFAKDLAAGSPTKSEIREIVEFTKSVAEDLENIAKKLSLGETLEVDGNNPVGPYYTPLGIDGQPAKFLKAKPKTDPEKCIDCGACARSCPMQSINYDNVFEVPGICIKCQACVDICPTDAKYFDDEAFLSHKEMLEKTYSEKKTSKFYRF